MHFELTALRKKYSSPSKPDTGSQPKLEPLERWGNRVFGLFGLAMAGVARPITQPTAMSAAKTMRLGRLTDITQL
jgi:hypothetical protein